MTDAPKDDSITHSVTDADRDSLGFDKIDTDRLSKGSLIKVDYERYAHFLEGIDASDEDKRAFVQTVWSIVFSIASLGFETHPVQIIKKICGKSAFRAAVGRNNSRQMIE